MCIFGSNDPPPSPKYTYESFRKDTSAKPEGPANDDELRRQREGDNAAKPTVGDGLGATGKPAKQDTISVGAQPRKSKGTTLGL